MDVSLKLLPDGESVWPDSYLLNSGSTLIGSGHNCSLHLDSPTVSRWHCIVDVAPNAVFITDLHSLNGTYVNNRRAIRQPLHNADILRLGGLSFLVGINSSSDLPLSSDYSTLAILPSSFSQPNAQLPSPAASAMADLLPRPVRQDPGLSSAPEAARRASHPLSQSSGQMAGYEKALIECTAQLRLLTEKVAALESRLNAITGPDQAPPPQHSPKKAFEPHDALMYIARAAVREKIRQQGVSPSLPPKP